jgi:metal transporter CNNM
MAIVLEPQTNRTVGIITLEDVLEELINEEILDETDVYVDIQKKVLAPCYHPSPVFSLK